MTPDRAEIKFLVKKATDIQPFTGEDGKRLIGYHYFLLDGKDWQFRWVDNTMDPVWLQKKIEEGVIYIFED